MKITKRVRFTDNQLEPFGMEEAKQLRLELMEERKKFVVDAGNAFENRNTFSLCEH